MEIANYRAAESELGGFVATDSAAVLDSRLRGNDTWSAVGLAALALLVAESDPKDKEVLIRLIMNMLAGGAT